jgi:hypothetical protein
LLEKGPAAVREAFPNGSTAGYAAAVVLLFFGIAYFLGFLLGSLSFAVVERPWRHFSPLNLEGLAQHLGRADTHELSSRFTSHFGGRLHDANLTEASFLCSYYVWKKDQSLGAMTGRLDAELLASRSLVLVSLGLILLDFGLMLVGSFRGNSQLEAGGWTWIASLSFILAGAVLGFKHLRKRKIYDRFSLFLAVTSEENATQAGLGPSDPK